MLFTIFHFFLHPHIASHIASLPARNSATVAKKLHEDSFALIFGINTLMALVMQSILTAIVLNTFEFDTRTQYQIYGYYFIGLAILYGMVGMIKIVYKRFR